MYQLRFQTVWQHWHLLEQGILVTVQVVVVSVLLSWFFGLFFAVCRLSHRRWISAASQGYIEFFRSTPELVQIFWVYFCLPIFFDIRLSSFWSGVIALTLFGSAYGSEIFRAGIQAVPRGHAEAARSLGMSLWQTFHRIVLPQALRIMIPPLVNHFADMVKVSALLYTIVVTELMYETMIQAAATFRGLEFLTVTAAIYFAMIYPFSLLARWLEVRLAARL